MKKNVLMRLSHDFTNVHPASKPKDAICSHRDNAEAQKGQSMDRRAGSMQKSGSSFQEAGDPLRNCCSLASASSCGE